MPTGEIVIGLQDDESFPLAAATYYSETAALEIQHGNFALHEREFDLVIAALTRARPSRSAVE